MKNKLQGSRVLITGAASGIGRQLALQAASRGAAVVIWDLSDSGQQVVEEIVAAGGSAEFHKVNITDREAVNQKAQKTGAVDVLINNAGVVSGDYLLDLQPELIEKTFQVNVLSLYWMTRAFLPSMVQNRKGHIVTIASAAGLIGVAKQTDYSASKFAAVGFMESLRAELRKKRISVGTLTVCPYFVDTGMFDGAKTKFPLLLPVLQPEWVAKKTLDSIENGKLVLVLPWFSRVNKIVRLLPVKAFDRIADFFGVNQTMDQFRGRSKISDGE